MPTFPWTRRQEKQDEAQPSSGPNVLADWGLAIVGLFLLVFLVAIAAGVYQSMQQAKTLQAAIASGNSDLAGLALLGSLGGGGGFVSPGGWRRR